MTSSAPLFGVGAGTGIYEAGTVYSEFLVGSLGSVSKATATGRFAIFVGRPQNETFFFF